MKFKVGDYVRHGIETQDWLWQVVKISLTDDILYPEETYTLKVIKTRKNSSIKIGYLDVRSTESMRYFKMVNPSIRKNHFPNWF